MAKLTEHELSSLIANALHRSGPDGNPERGSLSAAYARAATVISAIEGTGAVVIREERRYRRPWDGLALEGVDADAVEAEDGG